MLSLKLCFNNARCLRHRGLLRRFSSTSSRRADEVRIVEVGPRDGLQNEKNSIPLKTKIELIHRLARTGVRNIEAGSFVAPKWVPQMANSAEVLKDILERPPSSPFPISYNFLIPNLKGLENFLQAKEKSILSEAEAATIKSPNKPRTSPTASSLEPHVAKSATPSHPQILNQLVPETSGTEEHPMTEVSVFTAATESFSRANMNCTISESLERCKPIISLAKSKDIRVRGYVSVALGCPYEGSSVSPSKVAEITATLLEMGVDEVSIADTTGMGLKPRILELFKTLTSVGIAPKDLALHFHDTYGQALVNTILGLEYGIRTFDSSVGGLGGCPFSKGATGNVATEDIVYFLHSIGAKTGVDLEGTAKIGSWISAELGRANESRAGKAILARMSSE